MRNTLCRVINGNSQTFEGEKVRESIVLDGCYHVLGKRQDLQTLQPFKVKRCDLSDPISVQMSTKNKRQRERML